MARLTSYDEGNQEIFINEEERLLSSKGFIDKDEMYKIVKHLAEKLFEYEQLEEEGLLLKLPCKISDIVYEIKKYSYCPSGICHSDRTCSECREKSPWEISKKKFNLKDLKELGKTIFLTQEDAEHKLKEISK